MATSIAYKINRLKQYVRLKGLKKHINQLGNLNSQKTVDFLFSPKGAVIAPLQNRSELLKLATLVEKIKPKVMLEIGTAHGGTLFMHCKLAAEDALIISIDLPNGKFGAGYPEWKAPIYKGFGKAGQTVTLLREDSHAESTVEKLKGILAGRKLDYMFIDGDHVYEGVKKDFETYKNFVAPGGVIAFHDILFRPTLSQVDKLWNEIKNQYKYEEFIGEKHEDAFGIGVLHLNSKLS